MGTPTTATASANRSKYSRLSSAAVTVSLRLGHTCVLTCHRHVIHYARAASLPAAGRLCFGKPNRACIQDGSVKPSPKQIFIQNRMPK